MQIADALIGEMSDTALFHFPQKQRRTKTKQNPGLLFGFQAPHCTQVAEEAMGKMQDAKQQVLGDDSK